MARIAANSFSARFFGDGLGGGGWEIAGLEPAQ
jgi:hypothetical protein